MKVTAAIWVLAYNIARTDRLRYLEWFHHDHVAEKLARPGYQWAAHFEGETHGSATGASGYLALFGGDTTAIFKSQSGTTKDQTGSCDSRDDRSTAIVKDGDPRI